MRVCLQDIINSVAYKGGRTTLAPRNVTLTIGNAQYGDEGRYSCRAENWGQTKQYGGEVQGTSATLTVYGKNFN